MAETLLGNLKDLAYNLRWSWDPATQSVFEAIAPDAWAAGHNPIAVLTAARADEAGLAQHSSALQAAAASLKEYTGRAKQVPEDSGRIAYLSAEFAITECLPIYSGGLGVLAGDHLKAASDLGLDLRAVGLFYRYGYFRQQLNDGGWQTEQYDRQEPTDLPIRLVKDKDGVDLRIPVPFPGRTVWAQVWCAQVGRVPLYLLDTELPENREDDRWITGHLYGGDQDTRIRQEMVLGIGGARLLKVLGEPAPTVFHMNEGHSAFVALELARQRVQDGKARDCLEAITLNAPSVVFTTHTPVAAGHDAFAYDLMEAYFHDYRENELHLTIDELMQLGRREASDSLEGFSMTVLALLSAARRNAVSQLHGEVSSQMWGDVGLGLDNQPPAEPMLAVTNGVHTGTWIGPEMGHLFDNALGTEWRIDARRPEAWAKLPEADPAAVWQARTTQRARLLAYVREFAKVAGGAELVDSPADRTLVVGFARRFATYKRAALLLEDPERLAALLKDPERPVVLLFAGKAHPRDEPGKQLMQRIVDASRDERFRGHLVFLENYDVALARYLVQGSDIWLNTPRRPLEASGTSGMKAALNGSQHLSELDGWWDEAYQPGLGWALGAGISGELPPEEVDDLEALQLMAIMADEVIPLFFDRDAQGLPRRWAAQVAKSISVLAPMFSTQRMVAEYAARVYAPATRAGSAQAVGSAHRSE